MNTDAAMHAKKLPRRMPSTVLRDFCIHIRRTPGLTGAAPVASWNTNRTRLPRPVQADCSALCSLALDLPKLLFKKFRGYRVQVRGRWVSQGFSRSFWWPWRTARKSWLWLRRFVFLPVLHDSVAERLL